MGHKFNFVNQQRKLEKQRAKRGKTEAAFGEGAANRKQRPGTESLSENTQTQNQETKQPNPPLSATIFVTFLMRVPGI